MADARRGGGAHEVLDLRLRELALADEAGARRNLVAEGLAHLSTAHARRTARRVRVTGGGAEVEEEVEEEAEAGGGGGGGGEGRRTRTRTWRERRWQRQDGVESGLRWAKGWRRYSSLLADGRRHHTPSLTCATPNGMLPEFCSRQNLKLRKIPCAVSGRR